MRRTPRFNEFHYSDKVTRLLQIYSACSLCIKTVRKNTPLDPWTIGLLFGPFLLDHFLDPSFGPIFFFIIFLNHFIEEKVGFSFIGTQGGVRGRLFTEGGVEGELLVRREGWEVVEFVNATD